MREGSSATSLVNRSGSVLRRVRCRSTDPPASRGSCSRPRPIADLPDDLPMVVEAEEPASTSGRRDDCLRIAMIDARATLGLRARSSTRRSSATRLEASRAPLIRRRVRPAIERAWAGLLRHDSRCTPDHRTGWATALYAACGFLRPRIHAVACRRPAAGLPEELLHGESAARPGAVPPEAVRRGGRRFPEELVL